MADPNAADPSVSNPVVPDPSGSGAPSPWTTVDLNNPGWGDDSIANKPVQFWGLDGLSPDLEQNLYNAMRAHSLGQDPSTVDPGARPFMNLASLMSPPKVDLGPGVLGNLDHLGVASIAQPVVAAPSVQVASDDKEGDDDDQDIGEDDSERYGVEDAAAKIRQRDIDYLDRYYDAASRYSKQYKVNPAFVLGLGIESGFGTKGTYNRTGDAFGMTGGSTDHMTTAASPEENVSKFFQMFGPRINGAGDDVDAFINGLQARKADGNPIPGLKQYNSDRPDDWEKMTRQGIDQIRRDLPIYLPTRSSKSN